MTPRPFPRARSIARLLAAFLALSSLAHAGGGLAFEKTRVDAKVAAEAKKLSVPYTFTNTSGKDVTIARWDSACSCLNARIKGGKMTYKPGEKGEIVVDFELGSFSGHQVKTVLLWTTVDPAEKPSTVLSVGITIPEWFKVTPGTTIFWEKGAAAEARAFSILVTSGRPLHITGHSGTNANFPYRLETIREGREYRLTVTPKSTAAPAVGMIVLRTDADTPRYKSQRVFVGVRAKK